MARVIVKYGAEDQFAVEFKLDENGDVLGRYPADEIVPHDGYWEHRESVPETSHVIAALRTLLRAYGQGGLVKP
jgi:hypothetical protein